MHCGFSKTCNKVASSEKQKTVVVVIILEASVRHGSDSDSCSDSVVEQFLQVRTAFCNTLWMCNDCYVTSLVFLNTNCPSNKISQIWSCFKQWKGISKMLYLRHCCKQLIHGHNFVPFHVEIHTHPHS